MNNQASDKSRLGLYVMFVVSLIAFIGLLIFANEWFWLALPSLLTSLVYIFKVI